MKQKGNFQLIAFDLDGTLVEEESSWLTLHGYFGVLEETHKNLDVYIKGFIDFKEFMRRDIALWPNKLHVSVIEGILSNYTLKADAKKVMKELQRDNFHLVIISAGIDILANNVAKDLDISHVLANGLEKDNLGFLTGEGMYRVDLINKHKALENYASCLGFSLDECIAVGDSQFDINFLSNCGFSIAFDKDRMLLEKADVVITELIEVLDYIK